METIFYALACFFWLCLQKARDCGAAAVTAVAPAINCWASGQVTMHSSVRVDREA